MDAPLFQLALAPVETWLPWALMGAGCLLLVFWGLARSNAQALTGFLGKARPAQPPAPEHSRHDELAAITRDVEELAERLCARLDEKADRLERLLEAADARIEALEAAPPARKAAAPPAPSVTETKPQSRGRRSPSAKPASQPADPLSRRIYELADGGRPPADIARELDEHVGKVELILALRQG